MKIKKLLAAVLVFALCAAFFAACAKNAEPTPASTASEPTTETYESVKMCIRDRSFSVRGLTNLVPLSVPREKLFVYSGDGDCNMQYYVNGIFSSDADIEQFPD